MTATQSNNLDYLPWDWTITSLNKQEHTCPTVSSLLGTFAAVNGVVSALAVIFGHRHVVKKLTCGCFGHRGSRSWVWMWIVPVGLQLTANAFIALLIKKSAGYEADFKVSELMLFLVARPRLSWIVLGAFAFKSRKAKKNAEAREMKNGYMSKPNPSSAYDFGRPNLHDNSYSPWVSQHSFPNHSAYNSRTALGSYPYASSSPSYQYIPGTVDSVISGDSSQNKTDRDFPWCT